MALRRQILLATPTLIFTGGAAAQSWPQCPVRIIVNFGLGGVADVVARCLAEPLSKAFGQSLIV